MFTLATNDKIGAHLKCAINKKGYRSVRQFGKSCLEEQNLPTDEEELRKTSNRLSQILNGKRAVQLEDLPVFSKLLDISCEEILSAGESLSVSLNRVTNYSIALSQDEKEWKEYLNREDQLILNADEYGKTVIDYAFEHENYDFLKYLTEKKYIWFVGTDENDLFNGNFGAGTSIERNTNLMRNLNLLDSKIKEHYEFRMKMITLAIKKKDIKMLTELRAREIPSLYQACWYSCTPAECEKYYDEELIFALADASDEILKYFSNEFEIVDRIGIVNKFMFPYINQLADILIKTNNRYVEWVLKGALRHNQYVLEKLHSLLHTSVEHYKDRFSESIQHEPFKKNIIKSIVRDLVYYNDGELVSYRTVHAKDGIITNLVRVTAKSEEGNTNRLIQEVNETYDKILNIVPII